MEKRVYTRKTSEKTRGKRGKAVVIKSQKNTIKMHSMKDERKRKDRKFTRPAKRLSEMEESLLLCK